MHGQDAARDELAVLPDAEVPCLYPHHVVVHELQVEAALHANLTEEENVKQGARPRVNAAQYAQSRAADAFNPKPVTSGRKFVNKRKAALRRYERYGSALKPTLPPGGRANTETNRLRDGHLGPLCER